MTGLGTLALKGGRKMKRKEILILSLLSVIFTLIVGCTTSAPPVISEQIRYVATDGDNSNDGSEGSPWQTIQYALSNISEGGTVLVNAGVYNASISFPSNKTIILQSVNGASSTTIQGDDNSATVICSNSLEGTTIDGFTITHNQGDSGSGIEITGGYLQIKNCTVSNNSANYGGGIFNEYGTLDINASTISHNSATAYEGGGIYNYGTSTIITSTISNNSAKIFGGGIHIEYGTSTIIASTISNNSANCGGGINNRIWGTLEITESTISHNSATDSVGGIRNWGTLEITESTISHNSAVNFGGIWSSETLTITESTISYNSVDNEYAGLYLVKASIENPPPTPIVGGLGAENTICGNYISGEPPSLEQQIIDGSVIPAESLYDTYKNTNFISVYCTL